MSNGLTVLSKDEYDALAQIARPRRGQETACVARNAKRLSGLKYVAYGKNGQLALTEKGEQTLFVKSCIEGLRAISTDPLAPLEADVEAFLGRKGHIVLATAGAGFEITVRGRESLADIDSNAG
ncbi:hypothetical protein [Glaciimonas immobilis]|uniref:Uncharacterized protein n=1 Tax=Glaciimonas immobilis TaxID=728004 RepID=A0A840RPQ7_9BURK|nr:hypothetical protein [Glaciimonas immobilis]KAF3999252.1 hypothetical protein HAV38_04765 [Glaciimonas immobilis]MBB5198714.1 hypothetical protein [Glaciimonas immobilis]